MFALSAFRAQVVSRSAVRCLSVSSVSRKGDDIDFLQDLYLKEIRNYKPDAKASKADVTTKEFVAPRTPSAPKSDVNLEADVQSYEKNGVLSQ
ncbi:hypothetical protein GGI04_004625 [Coemansia thaxteri]|uniref:Uncharacterized protein n=1 Tax=Coemansia thaxteri TaxID=2663907 RepID=A0A9W8EEA1_9FUNG|nr:hypothetical protein GGI04_004625 [Coemansia thaxteri]KAJ2001371.1 hypothetical protein H4R26_004166 [Coemansia thaxteri]